MNKIHFSRLWDNIVEYLDEGWNKEPHWRQRIIELGQLPAIHDRQNGRQWTDNEIFESIIKAVFSNQTQWLRIEKNLENFTLCSRILIYNIIPH